MQEELDIVDTAMAAGNFTTLMAAIAVAGLTETLQGEGPFTVFAPTDEAFAKVPSDTLKQLLQPENQDKLTAILTYHVVAGKMNAQDVTKNDSLKTIQGQELSVTNSDGVSINHAKVIAPDVTASNGVIHVIDTVLLPAAAATA